MTYDDYLPAYLREDTGRNAREWERRLRRWANNHDTLPTHHWTKVGQGSTNFAIWQLWRVQDEDPQLADEEWRREPAMYVLTKRSGGVRAEILQAGFLRIRPLSLPHDYLTEVSERAREMDLRERQRRLTTVFDQEMREHINRIYGECVREHIRANLREERLTLLRDTLCVADPSPPTKYADKHRDFQRALTKRADLRKRTAKELTQSMDRDLWWPTYRMVDDEDPLPSLYLAEYELVHDWEPGYY